MNEADFPPATSTAPVVDQFGMTSTYARLSSYQPAKWLQTSSSPPPPPNFLIEGFPWPFGLWSPHLIVMRCGGRIAVGSGVNFPARLNSFSGLSKFPRRTAGPSKARKFKCSRRRFGQTRFRFGDRLVRPVESRQWSRRTADCGLSSPIRIRTGPRHPPVRRCRSRCIF